MPNRLQKAIQTIWPQTKTNKNEPRGAVSGFTLGVSPLWGQPYPEVQSGDASGLITRERMREVVMRTPTAAACLNAILDFAGGVKIGVRNIDPSEKVSRYQAKMVRRILKKPNDNQTGRQFFLTLIRDLVTFGYGAVEIVRTGKLEQPVQLWVMDAARLRIDFDEHGYIKGFDMLDARGVPIVDVKKQPNMSDLWGFPQGSTMGATSGPIPPSVPPSGYEGTSGYTSLHGWEPPDVIYFTLNPISESAYPHSKIVQLFSAALLEDLMLEFISERFTDSNIPFGVFDLGDVTETELKLAIDNWNAQAANSNRILMTGSKGSGSKWIPFGYHLKDLEATELLREVRGKIMSIMGVTMNELGESQDVNKSNGYNLSFTFKKRAIEPVLDEVTETLTARLLWEELGYRDAELYYEEIDSRDDFLMSQIDNNYERFGILTINEIRNRKGLTSVPGGDEPFIFTGNSWVPVDMVRDLAKQLLVTERNTTAIENTVAENTRIRADIAQPGRQLPGTPNSFGEFGQSNNGHQRGQPSETARQLTGTTSLRGSS
jgi:hypothetical protein